MRKVYEYDSSITWCTVYDYILDTIPEMERMVGN